MTKLQIACLSAGVLVGVLATTSSASAQDAADLSGSSDGKARVPAPQRATEFTLGTGYTQGFGSLQRGSAVRDTAEAGVNIDLAAAYRLSPRWALGINGGYQFYDAGDEALDDSLPQGATGRIAATYHFDPYSRLDPWLELGTGYRYLGERNQPDGNARLHGIEWAHLNAGIDLRLDEQLGLAPVIGAGLDTFFWDGTTAVADPRLSAFAFAGLRLRLDVGGEHRMDWVLISAR